MANTFTGCLTFLSLISPNDWVDKDGWFLISS